MIPYTQDTVNKMYTDTKDFLTDIYEQVGEEDLRLTEWTRKHKMVEDKFNELNHDVYHQLEVLRFNEIARISKLESFKKFKSKIRSNQWISKDLKLETPCAGCGYSSEDLIDKFASEEYKKQVKELIGKIISREEVQKILGVSYES